MAQCILICVGVVAIAIGPMRRRHVEGDESWIFREVAGGYLPKKSDVSGRMIVVKGKERRV